MKTKKVHLFMLLCIIAVCALVGCGTTREYENQNIRTLTIAGDVQTESEDVATISGTLMESMENDDSIFFRLRNGTVTIWKNETEIYTKVSEIENQDSILFSSEWCKIQTSQLESTDMLTIKLEGNHAEKTMAELLNSLCGGDAFALLHMELRAHFLQILIGMLIIILAVAYGITFFSLHGVRTELSFSYVACALLLLCGGVCTLIDYDYITLIFQNLGIINFVDYISQCLICVFLLLYLYTFIKRKNCKNLIKLLVGVLVAFPVIDLILQALGQYYEQQIISAAMLVMVIFSIFVFMWVVQEQHGQWTRNIKLLLGSSLLLTITISIEILHYFITSVYYIVVFQAGLLFYAVVQFAILLSDTKEKFRLAEEMETKMHENRISIMLSQIQPHFLYNALNTIQYLCETNPKQASKTIENFARYLRGNMDSLTCKVPIPVAQEMEHLKQYLKIEQLRFEDVQVQFDLQTLDFMLPALTIQPLVENAIKYGVARQEGGGIVWIATWEDEENWYVKIEDNGIGFDPMQVQYDGRSHIGIQNTQERLKAMCHGEMEIKSRPMVGTEVLLTVPKEMNISESNNHR